jgi:inorganic pyrophosphatase
VRSSKKTSADAFREQYKTLEQKQKIKKQEWESERSSFCSWLKDVRLY